MADKLLEDILSASEDLNTDLTNFESENEKLSPLLEDIELIQDDSIRQFVRAVLLRADAFWVAESSTIPETHPPDEYAPGGLVLHTRRVVRTVWLLAETQQRTSEEIDMLLAAALLHDTTKAVEVADGSITLDAMHPYTVDKLVRRVGLFDEQHADNLGRSTTLHLLSDPAPLAVILRLIRCHEGAMSPIPETIPVTSLEWILHLSNQVACHLHHLVDGPVIPEWRWNTNTKKRNVRSK